MFAPHTVTLYMVTESADFHKNIDTTILDGVFLDTTQSRSVSTKGTGNADRATLFVPLSVKAYSLDGKLKQYVDVMSYRAMDDPSRFWTLDGGGDSSPADCYFVKGLVGRTMEYAEAKKLFSDVYKVSSFATRDFGSEDMQHWQVSAT